MGIENQIIVGLKNYYWESISNSQLVLKILDVHGHFVTTIKKTLLQGDEDCALDLDGFSEGQYVVNAFVDGSFVRSLKFMKK